MGLKPSGRRPKSCRSTGAHGGSLWMVGRWLSLFIRQLGVYRSCYPSVRRCCAVVGNLLHGCVCVSPLVAYGSDAGVCLRTTLWETWWGQLDHPGGLGAMLRLALGSSRAGLQLAAARLCTKLCLSGRTGAWRFCRL